MIRQQSDEPAAVPAPPAKEFSPEMIRLRNKIRTCLSYYYQRPTSVNERSPWGIMHSLISFGVDTELVGGQPAGQRDRLAVLQPTLQGHDVDDRQERPACHAQRTRATRVTKASCCPCWRCRE